MGARKNRARDNSHAHSSFLSRSPEFRLTIVHDRQLHIEARARSLNRRGSKRAVAFFIGDLGDVLDL